MTDYSVFLPNVYFPIKSISPKLYRMLIPICDNNDDIAATVKTLHLLEITFKAFANAK